MDEEGALRGIGARGLDYVRPVSTQGRDQSKELHQFPWKQSDLVSRHRRRLALIRSQLRTVLSVF
jgi:hypothetical protein